MSGGVAVAILPVRVDSRRLPRKALLAETGRALFLHTWERARAARAFAEVYVATDSTEVATAARHAGAAVIMTGSSPRTGSERCAEAAAGIEAEYIVDVQGDWPEVDPADLDSLVETLRAGRAPVATLACPFARSAREDGLAEHAREDSLPQHAREDSLAQHAREDSLAQHAREDAGDAGDPNVVKVVVDLAGRALYFSRSPVPHVRPGQRFTLLRHVGVYGFTRETLLALPGMQSSGLEDAEGLEQLRWLENGVATAVVIARGQPWGIEAYQDYQAFLARWSASAKSLAGGGRT